jgi:hypothetical protein
MNIKRNMGLLLIAGSVTIGLVDRFTRIISNALGRLYCGDSYLQPVNSVTGDVSCGFNADIYLVAFLLISLLIGLILMLTSRNK